MDELIIRFLQGRATPDEEKRLRAWTAREAENERRYHNLRELWNLTEVAVPEPEPDLPDTDALIAVAEAETETRQPTPIAAARSGAPRDVHSGRPGFLWRPRTAVGVLAAGLVGVGFGIGTLMDGRDGPTLLSESEIVTGAGEMTTVTLGDGSSIRLGPESRLRLTEDQDRRLAWLDGRAFFGVQADSARPFTVRTEHGDAQVLGTRFEVRLEEAGLRVLVVQGRVSVAVGEEEIDISDGQMARAARDGRVSIERVQDVYQHLDWLGNAVVFQATRFDHALREIERRYDVNIRLENPGLAGITVTATFTGHPIEEVIFVLCEIVDTTCAVDDERIRIGIGEARTTSSTDTP